MKILNKLEELLAYYETTRQAGHTTLMRTGTDAYDRKKLVLAHNADHGANLGFKPDEVISWQNLSKLKGHNKPLAIDNGALYGILRDTINEMIKMEDETKNLEAKLELIRRILK